MVSRRVVLGSLASALWPSRWLFGQDAGVQMISVEGEGARYWPRWRGPSGQESSPEALTPTRGLRPRTFSGRHRFPAAATLHRSSGGGSSDPHDGTRRRGGCRFSRSVVPMGCVFGKRWHRKGATDPRIPRMVTRRPRQSPTGNACMCRLAAGDCWPVVDLNGAVVWQRDLGAMDAYHGTAGSPLVQDRIILYQDQLAGSFVAAFEARTGRVMWRTNPRGQRRLGVRRLPFA